MLIGRNLAQKSLRPSEIRNKSISSKLYRPIDIEHHHIGSGHTCVGNLALSPRGYKSFPGGNLVQTMPRCMCPKVKDIGTFSASRE